MNEEAEKILAETLDLVARDYVQNCGNWPFAKAFRHATRQILSFFPCRDAMESAYVESRRRVLAGPHSQAANVLYAGCLRAIGVGLRKSPRRLLKAVAAESLMKRKVALVDAWLERVAK